MAILARGAEPIETRRGLPGDPEDAHSRYIEAAVNGLLVGCLYLPNGNPAPGPKFDYKLRWFERLAAHARRAAGDGRAGGPRRRLQRHADRARRLQAGALGRRCAVPAGGARRLSRAASHRAGPTLCARFIRTSASTPSGTTSGTPGPRRRPAHRPPASATPLGVRARFHTISSVSQPRSASISAAVARRPWAPSRVTARLPAITARRAPRLERLRAASARGRPRQRHRRRRSRPRPG